MASHTRRQGEALEGTKLPLRLLRETDWKAQTGCSLFVGLILLAVAAGVAGMEWTHATAGRHNLTVLLFAGVFGLVGAVLLYMALHQMLAMRTNETIVEVEERPL